MDDIKKYKETDINKYAIELICNADMNNKECIDILNYELANRLYKKVNCNEEFVCFLQSRNSTDFPYSLAWLGYHLLEIDDVENAIEILELSASFDNPQALNTLGYVYSSKKLGRLDNAKAIAYFTKAMNFGNITAIYNLANHYAHGEGEVIDISKAKKLYKEAALKGSFYAPNSIGWIYYNSPDKKEKATKWFIMGMERGCAYATCNLGCLYQHGAPFEEDLEKAKYYLELSLKMKPNHYKAAEKLWLHYFHGFSGSMNLYKALEMALIICDYDKIKATLLFADGDISELLGMIPYDIFMTLCEDGLSENIIEKYHKVNEEIHKKLINNLSIEI